MSILRRFGTAFGRLGPLQKGLAIIGVGVLGFVLLMVLRPRPEHQEPARRMPLVTTVPADVRSGNLTVRGSGTVRPKSEIVLSPQVAGRVEWAAPGFVSGGRFRRGDLLLRIEAADFENAVEAAAATVAQRQVEVMQWEQERELAREEYERLRAREGIEAPPDSGALGSLIFREPQLQAANAALRSAEARLDDAHLALARTRITAPFDCVVRAKSVDVGQYVALGQNLGSLYDTDEVEIVVALTDAEAALVEGLWDAAAGQSDTRIPATATASFGGRTYSWEAYVDRAEGALNPETRAVDVVVRVPDPFVRDESGRPPLLLGTWTDVDIRGAFEERYVVLPRVAFRDGGAVWAVRVVQEDTVIVIEPAEALQEVEGSIYLRTDLEPGEPVIVSPLAVVTDGMAVRIAEGGRQ